MSVVLGQDANWDLLNYHLYNGAALLDGRFDRDLLAAGMQSYFNPLLDASYAGLALGPLRGNPRLLAGLMGLWFGAALYLAARISMLLYPGRPWVAATATLLGVTGVAMVSQVGTTTGEVQTAAVMAGGLYAALRGDKDGRLSRASCLAGVLFGVAAGLKLTATAFAPAACLAVAALHRPRRVPAACAIFSASWLLGFAAVDGWWAWRVYERFGSPVFPLFNSLFRSDWYPPADLIDGRFFPSGASQWLFYPFYWMRAGGHQPMESAFSDPRGATAMGLGLAALVAWVARSRRAPPFDPAARAVLVFLAAGYATWLLTSAILRYAVILELVAGIATPLLLARLLYGRALACGLAAVIATTFVTTRYPASFRAAYGRETLRADADWIDPGDLIILTARAPISYIVPLLPHQDSIRVMNVGNTVLEARGWSLHDEFVRRVSDHSGRIVVLTAGDPQRDFPELREVGLDPRLHDCIPIETTLEPATANGAHACKAGRMGLRRLESAFWRQAALRYRTLQQPSSLPGELIGAAYLQAAGPDARGTRFRDWTDLLWTGVGVQHDHLPERLDPHTLYVLGPTFALAMAGRLDAAHDVLGRVDGMLVAAPGWRDCAACTARLEPIRIADIVPLLSVGGSRRLGREARASGFLLDGWWPQEEFNVWSEASAEMIVPLAPGLPERSTLALSGRAFTGPHLPRQRIVAEIVGQPESVVTQTFAGEGVIRLPVRREWLAPYTDGSRLLRLRLSFPDSTSPARLGMSVDPRVLGFSPDTVSLEALPDIPDVTPYRSP